MKRGWKIFWIVCGICAGVGLVCCALAFFMGVTTEAIENRFPDGIGIVGHRVHIGDDHDDYDDDYDDYDYDDDDYDDDDYDDDDYDDDDYDDDGYHEGTDHAMEHKAEHGAVTYAGSRKEVISGSKSQTFTGVDAIDAYLWGGILEVDNDASSPDEIRVETENISQRLGLKCYMDGNELKIVTKKKVIGVGKKKAGRLILHVPKDYKLWEADLSLVGGYLHITDIHAEELSVDVGAGEGVVENFTATEADFQCGAGSLTTAGTASAKVEIDCGVGEISYTAGGKEKDYNYEIDCGIGEIVCGTASYSGIGSERTVRNNAARDMEISCGMGAVAVTFAED